MNVLRDTGLQSPRMSSPSRYMAVIVVMSVISLVATYFLINSALSSTIKMGGFLCITAGFLIVSGMVHFRASQTSNGGTVDELSTTPDADRQLRSLDDAREFFAGSLSSSDSFRLVASRVREIFPFRTATLYIFDDIGMCFRATESQGPDAEHRRNRTVDLSEGTLARTFFSQVVETDHATASSRPAVAIPLKDGLRVFGALHLDFEMNFDLAALDLDLVDAIGTRSAPLMLSSISYEQSQENALTDFTTDLPSERAFYLVLENQVAETQRKGSARPLTVLAIDVRSFDEINSRFGHPAGDRVLSFVAQTTKHNLRQMDFLARASADEFLVVLPTASKEISHDVIARIQTGFFGRKLKVTEGESVEIELNIGLAAFGSDGETPETLLRVARQRKDQSKINAPTKVLWFPTEFAS